MVKQAMKHGTKSPVLEEKKYMNELFKEYQETKDIDIRNQLIERYIYIPEILSKKYVNKGTDYEDIFQVASMGLIFAIERFDLSKGYEFASFATPTIIGEIKKHFRDKEWLIRVPRRIQNLSKKINVTKMELQQSLLKTPTIEDIANHLDLTVEEVIEAMEGSYAYSPKSLDMTYNLHSDDKELSLIDMLGETDKNIERVADKDFLIRAMDKLDEIEREIIKDRFYHMKTQSEIADKLGVSQMTVSRLEKKVIEKFKKELEK